MIFEAVVGFFVALVDFFLGLLPSSTPPEWFLTAGDAVSDVLAHAAGLGAWLPLPLAVTVFGALLASVLVGFGIKVVRIVASFFTAGGGSAA